MRAPSLSGRSIRIAGPFAVLAFLALAGPASAHAHLKSATPAMNGTVATAPTELDLTFSEGIDAKFSGIKLTGPDRKTVPTGKSTLGAAGDATLVVPIPAPLAAGTYKVDWHAFAADGHKTNGSYGFTIKP